MMIIRNEGIIEMLEWAGRSILTGFFLFH
jgi:hypothetical protein